jgi:photosystem II stability/assembly factor-like uncharacterized protein
MLKSTLAWRYTLLRYRSLLCIAFILTAAACSVSVASAQQYSPDLYKEMQWRMIGPFRGGRTRAATGVPGQQNVFYVAPVDGGVWKSNDYGRTWNPIFDGEPTQSIGDIAVAPSDPKIIYVSSGEALQRPDLSVGDGIYKSTDAGKTWIHLGLRDGQQIPALAIDPHDPNRVFAAVLGHPYGPNAERGIFRSTDGGKSWQKVLYKDEKTGGYAVAIDPANPKTVYATLWQARQGPSEDDNSYTGTEGGIFKSTDGGGTWHKLTKGLPDDLVQANIAIAPSQPNTIYATIATTHPGGYESGDGLGFMRSDNGGESWYRTTDDARPVMLIGGGDLPMPKVDPQNPDVVYSTSIVTVRSTDGGKTWTSLRGAPGGDDYQNIWINPNNPKIILLVSDQGALVSVNGGETWSSWYNQPTAQLYHVAVTNGFPYFVCSGQQESGSVCTATRGNTGEITFRDWRPVGVIEYGYVAPDPLNPDIIYGAGRTEVSKYHWSTGQVQNVTPIPFEGKYRADRTEPIVFSPVDPHVLYYAANVLFKTTDGGESWQTISPDLARKDPGLPESLNDLTPSQAERARKQRGAIYALAPSFMDLNTIWAGTDDGLVWITRDGGKNWSNITPPELTSWSKVTQIAASSFDNDSAYVSVSRMRINDLRPYIYRTHDGGKSWQLITAGLPDAPVNAVREDPVRKGLLFAAAETGVWVSFDDGDHWQSLQLNLPHTSMRDLAIHDDDLIVATHGRSFWILDGISPLRQISDAAGSQEANLFKPAEAYRVRRSTNTDTPLPADEPAGQNPPNGAIIDYSLAQAANGPVTLEILDSQGKLVRRYSSADPPELTKEELQKQMIPTYWVRMPETLGAAAGMHRWVWDLHYSAPIATHYEYPISAVPHRTPRVPQGPLAVPGEYSVRLTVDGKSYTVPLMVKIDPRVKATQVQLEQEFNAETRLASMLTESSKAELHALSTRDQLKKLEASAKGAIAKSIKDFDERLNPLLGGKKKDSDEDNSQPDLGSVNLEVFSLYKSVGQADAAPTPAQMQAIAKVEQELNPLVQRWEQINGSLSELNSQLKNANLPPVNPELKPETQAARANEE